MSARLDYATGGEAGYTGADAFGVMPLAGDVFDTAQMAPFNAGAGQGMAWWETIAAYGITRAIDNRFGPTNIAGNTNPGTFGGQSGATVANKPLGTGGGITGAAGGPVAGMGSSGLLLLIGAAVLGVLALRG